VLTMIRLVFLDLYCNSKYFDSSSWLALKSRGIRNSMTNSRKLIWNCKTRWFHRIASACCLWQRYHALHHVQLIVDDACTSDLRASRKTTTILRRTVEERE